MSEDTQLSKKESVQAASDAIAKAIAECGIVALEDQPPFMRAIRTATGLKMIRAALTDAFMTSYILPLQNSALGFLTDKPQGGYDLPVVRDCVCEAFLRGFHPTGNEFNIIAGRFYGAKSGFDRIVREYPGIQDLRYELGVPNLAGEKGALVSAIATWSLAGKPDKLICDSPKAEGQLDTRIPVRINAGMGPDAILGKAERKLLARIYRIITGTGSVVEMEAEIVSHAAPLPSLSTPENDGKRMRMGAARPSAEKHDPVTGEVPTREREAPMRDPGVD